ncbi:MAG TPA: type II secretion system protein GspM [Haliangium sp.]|nr:type II secretion system protein GspM [Haliangium sp.]
MATSIERLRDRWEQISPREQRLILALGITFLLVVLVLLGRGITGGLAELEAKIQKTRTTLRVLEDYRQNAGASTGEAQEVKLPDEPVKLQSYLESIASEVGITIPAFNPQSGATRDGVVTAATRFQLRGISLEQLTSFLEKVESKLPYVVVESVDIKRDFRDSAKLEADLLVTTYANAKKEAAGEGDKDKAKAKDKPARAAEEEG